MKCYKCKHDIMNRGDGRGVFVVKSTYWGSCDCADWRLVRAD